MPDASTIEGGLFPDQRPDQFSTGDDYKASRAAPSTDAGDTKNRTYPDPLAPIPTKDLDSALDIVLNNYRQSQEDRTASIDYGKRAEQLGKDYDAHLPERKELLGKLKAPQAGPSPQFQYRSPIEAFGSLGTVIGALGSFFSRKPMTAAMNAMAAGMEGVYKNDVDTFNREYGVWKNQTELALKQADMENGIIKTILDDDSKSWDEKLNLVKSYGAALHDRAIFDAASSADARAVTDIATRKIEVSQQLRDRLPELDKEAQRMQMLTADPDWQSGDPQRMRVAYQKVQEAISPYTAAMGDPKRVALQAFIEQWKDQHNGEFPPASAIAAFNASNASVRSAPALAMRKYMEEHPDATADQVAEFGANYAARSKAVSAFGTGKQGDTVRSFNALSEHLTVLEQLADALDNGDTKAFNAVAQKWAAATGNPAPTNFETAVNMIGTEVVKAIAGAAGGVTDREEARASFNKALADRQLRGAADTVRRLVTGQLHALEAQYVDSTTVGVDDPEARNRAKQRFASKLSPNAKKAFMAEEEASIPDEAKKKLKRGVNTVFSTPSGPQTWTLDENGTPRQVK